MLATESYTLAQTKLHVLSLLLGGALNPLDPKAFQTLFGMIMTLLIAMKFKHSILRAALRHEGIIRLKTVILIALKHEAS